MEGFAVLNVRRTLLVLSRSFMRRDSGSHRPITRHFSAPALTWKSWTAWCFQSFFYTYISDINSRCIECHTLRSWWIPPQHCVLYQYIHIFLAHHRILISYCIDVFLFYCTTSLWKLDIIFNKQLNLNFFCTRYMYIKLWFRYFIYWLQVLWTSNGVRFGYMMRTHAKRISCCKTDFLLQNDLQRCSSPRA